MTRQLLIGMIAEGSTDFLMLKSIIARTFDKIKFECHGDIDIMEIEEIRTAAGLTFVEKALEASRICSENGISILCIHSDADARDITNVNQVKFEPALQRIQASDEGIYCQNIVKIIPVQETEAWMLADTALLKSQIGTTLMDTELGIHRSPETVAGPKEVIEAAIRVARQNLTGRRRRDLRINDLYQPVGQSVDLERLEQLPSFRLFVEEVQNVLTALNLRP